MDEVSTMRRTMSQERLKPPSLTLTPAGPPRYGRDVSMDGKRVIVTGADVLHSWAMPAFGVKMDAVPGRLNETWFHAEQTGTYYGQCSELCGIRHAFMPIRVEVVEPEAFASWVVEAQAEYAQLETSKNMLADAGNLDK